MKRAVPLAAAAVLAAGLPVSAPADSALDWLDKGGKSREAGALPVEGLVAQPIRVRANPKIAVAVYGDLDMKRRLGVVPAGRELTIIALSDKGHYKVRGQALHAGVSGWVRAQDIVSTQKNLDANLRAVYARAVMVNDLIRNKQVALGMTPDEVLRSIGKPNQKSFKLTQAGRQERYEYVTYDRVLQYETRRDAYGRLYNAPYYVNVETGRLSVGFENGAVASIEEKEGNPLGRGGVRTVPAPIIFR